MNTRDNHPTVREVDAGRRSLLQLFGAGAAVAGAVLPFAALAAPPYQLRVQALSAQRIPVQAVIDKFIAKYSGSTVNSTAVDIDQLYTSTRVSLSAGNAADILTVQPGNGNPITIGQLSRFLGDLSAMPFAGKVPASLNSLVKVDGKLLMLPTTLSTVGGIYNTKTFESKGWAQPKTWTEFLGLCEKIKGGGMIPIAAGNGTNWVNQLITYALLPSLVYADNPDFNEDRKNRKVKFATSGWKEALNKYLELQKLGFLSPNPNGTSLDEQLQMVASGKAAMAIVTSGNLANVFKYAGHRDFAILPVPSSDNPAKFWTTATASNGFAANAKASNPEAVQAFLNFVAEPDSVYIFGAAAVSPTVLPSAANPEVDKIFRAWSQIYRQGKTVPYPDFTWPNPRPQQIHNAGVQELLAGKTTVDDLLKRMDEAYDA